ncbi:MAG: TIR domain-containing protein, partial [Anaerolineae bacterium]|nr:TIR domain-containing protein [Anaerolineae bacterium]
MGTKVFISYKSEYRDFARKVQQRLRDWGYETWFDMDDIPKGAYFRHAIQEGLDTSDVLVGVMTQEAFQSREVMAEWDYFLSQDKDVVPLKYRECKPLYHLVTIQWIDFTANERQGFAQLRDSLQRIIAAPEPAPEAEEKRDDVDEQIAQIEREAPKPPALDDLLIMPPATYAPGSPAPQPAPVSAAPPAPIIPIPMPAAPVTKPPADTGSGHYAPTAPLPAEPERQPSKPAAAAGTGSIPPLPTAPQQMAARKSANRWLRPLAALAAVLLVGVALIGGLGTPPNMALTQPGGIASWLLPVIALIAAGAGYWYVARRRAADTATVDARTQQTNRQRMLDKVEEFWVKGVLENALAESGAFDLGLAAVPGATLRHRDYGDYPLPSSASIGDVFDDMQRELLILGAPGAGKTILLLSLARELLSRARADSKLPIPVVFNLSSWAAERKSLDEWLVDELRLKYQAPRRVAEGWLVSDLLNKSASAARRQAQALVTDEQLTLLLDGLDEVAAAHRDACAEAINAFRVAHPQVDIAVCSRSADYDLLTSKLDLRGAVVLQPLSEAQINTYLDRPQLGALRETLPSDAALREMAATPFLLNTMAAAYQGASAASLRLPPSDDPLKARRTHLFDAFVQKRLYS